MAMFHLVQLGAFITGLIFFAGALIADMVKKFRG
jgi:hypothetical protein